MRSISSWSGPPRRRLGRPPCRPCAAPREVAAPSSRAPRSCALAAAGLPLPLARLQAGQVLFRHVAALWLQDARHGPGLLRRVFGDGFGSAWHGSEAGVRRLLRRSALPWALLGGLLRRFGAVQRSDRGGRSFRFCRSGFGWSAAVERFPRGCHRTGHPGRGRVLAWAESYGYLHAC